MIPILNVQESSFFDPLISLVVVIMNVSIDFTLKFRKGLAVSMIHMIPYMAKKGFPRDIVPTVSVSGHRLGQTMFLQ